MLNLFNVSYLLKTFTHKSDELPSGRKKIIHTFGSVAKVRLNITENTTYTGIFKDGAQGVVRLSLAAAGGSFTPGMALKFFHDKKESVNIFAMNSLDGQGGNRNFFELPFTNEIHGPTSPLLKAAAKAFLKAVLKVGAHRTATYLPLDHLAQNDFEPLKAPAVIKFVPAQVSFDPKNKKDVRELLKTVPAGVVLYNVYVSSKRRPYHKFEKLGELVTTSGFIASEYGDKKLFFRHH